MEHVRGSGFPFPASVVHAFVGGSALHGAKIGATDDLDVYGVFIEPPERALGLAPLEHFVWSTAGDERRNGPDDVDVTLYSLRKRSRLAASGNPTASHFLFAERPEIGHPIWERYLRPNASLFLSREAAAKFLGFARNQLARITEKKGWGAKGRRPE